MDRMKDYEATDKVKRIEDHLVRLGTCARTESLNAVILRSGTLMAQEMDSGWGVRFAPDNGGSIDLTSMSDEDAAETITRYEGAEEPPL
jgi:hypothetical protein